MQTETRKHGSMVGKHCQWLRDCGCHTLSFLCTPIYHNCVGISHIQQHFFVISQSLHDYDYDLKPRLWV
jgi:hypothetical protein